MQVNFLNNRTIRFWRARALELQPHYLSIIARIHSRDPVAARGAMDRYFETQRARFERDESLRSVDLSSQRLVKVVSDMIGQSKGLERAHDLALSLAHRTKAVLF